jgi:hypothetical protein
MYVVTMCKMWQFSIISIRDQSQQHDQEQQHQEAKQLDNTPTDTANNTVGKQRQNHRTTRNNIHHV